MEEMIRNLSDEEAEYALALRPEQFYSWLANRQEEER
jgi:hypothetical protein